MNKIILLKSACKYLALFCSVLCISMPLQASQRKTPVGKPVYCDTSAGRTVLNNGSYSKLYCRNHAITNIQTIHGCCTWAGGIMAVKNGDVICRNGALSAVCSLQNHGEESNQNFDGTVSFDDDM